MGANQYLLYEALKKLSHNKEQKTSSNSEKDRSTSDMKDQQSDSNTEEETREDHDTYVLTLSHTSTTDVEYQTLFEE